MRVLVDQCLPRHLAAERALQSLLVRLADERLIRSAHDCSDGGLAVTLAECCFDANGIGVEVAIGGIEVCGDPATNRAAALFGESASRVVVSASPERATDVVARAAKAGVPARVIGRTGEGPLRIDVAGQRAIDVPIAEAARAWSTAISRYFVRRAA